MGSKKTSVQTSVQILSPRDVSNVSIYEVERYAFRVSSDVTIGIFRVVTSWLEVLLSIKLLSEGHKERALHLLKLALEKDPEYVKALIVMGQILLQKQLNAEVTEYLERAITKLFIAGHPTEVEDIDNLILASQWAGVAHIRQGKIVEGIVHLERIAQLDESDEPKSKAHYFDGLLMLASALSNVGRKDEAVKHLRLAAAYNPAYNEYLEQCENEDDSVVSGKRKIQHDRKRLGNKKKGKKNKS